MPLSLLDVIPPINCLLSVQLILGIRDGWYILVTGFGDWVRL